LLVERERPLASGLATASVAPRQLLVERERPLESGGSQIRKVDSVASVTRKCDMSLRDKERKVDCISNLNSDISDFKSEISDLKSLAESCSRQLRAWADSLQNSDIKGQRHLTERSKSVFEQQKRADAFWERVEAAAQARMTENP